VTTTMFPDISGYQAGISLAGAPIAAIKATEGTGYVSSDYQPALGRARAAGCFPVAYHFLHGGNAAGQAAFCHGRVGATPLMLDAEPTGSSRPSLADVQHFIDAYRSGGGVCNLVYLPRWYWSQIGSPSLTPLIQRRMALWSSAYTTYTDGSNGAGWLPYGGMPPKVWQWTDRHSFHGQLIDFNAFRGTVDQFKEIAGSGAPPPGPPANGAEPTVKQGDSGPAVSKAQGRLNLHGARPALTVDAQFGALTTKEAKDFQTAHKLTVDGVIGSATWQQLDKAPAAPPAEHADPAAPGKPYHGQWVTAGQMSLEALCQSLGYTTASVLRMTAAKYGAFDPVLAAYVNGVFRGTTAPTAPIAAGASLWMN